MKIVAVEEKDRIIFAQVDDDFDNKEFMSDGAIRESLISLDEGKNKKPIIGLKGNVMRHNELRMRSASGEVLAINKHAITEAEQQTIDKQVSPARDNPLDDNPYAGMSVLEIRKARSDEHAANIQADREQMTQEDRA